MKATIQTIQNYLKTETGEKKSKEPISAALSVCPNFLAHLRVKKFLTLSWIL